METDLFEDLHVYRMTLNASERNRREGANSTHWTLNGDNWHALGNKKTEREHSVKTRNFLSN
jgi:hypothetical protein